MRHVPVSSSHDCQTARFGSGSAFRHPAWHASKQKIASLTQLRAPARCCRRLTMASAWQEVATEASARPRLPRSGHAAIALPSAHVHDVLIFGGYTEDPDLARQATNEAWVFSVADETWSAVTYKGTSIPRGRLVTQALVYGSEMYIIGGWDPGHKKDGGEILGDVWKLDLQTFEWTEVHVGGLELPQVSRHQAARLGAKAYIHTHRSTDDILCLDLDAQPLLLSSVPVAEEGGSPASRGLHSMTELGGRLYVYGGAPRQGGMLGDLWALDTESRRWREIDADGRVPHVRCSHAAAPFGRCIAFFGGSYYRQDGGLQPDGALFAFDAEAQAWRHPSTILAGGPGPRNAHTITPLPDGRLLIYGGWEPFRKSFNDTYILDPEAVDWCSDGFDTGDW